MTFSSDSTPPLFSTSQSPRTRESASEEREGEKKKKNYSPAKIEECFFLFFFIFRSFTCFSWLNWKNKKNSGNGV